MINITANAVDQLKYLLEEEDADTYFRVIALNDNQYGFVFETKNKGGDLVVEQEGIKFLVDPKSINQLRYSIIDYVIGSEFVVNKLTFLTRLRMLTTNMLSAIIR